MKTHWLDLDFTSSNFYHYSRSEKEGYVEHISKNGNKSYRRLYKKGVFGVLDSVGILDTDFGQRLTVRVVIEDDAYVMKFPLFNEQGNVDNRYGEPLICLLPNLKIGTAYRFFPYSMEGTPAEGQTAKTFYGVSVKLADLESFEVSDKVEPKFIRAKRDEEVQSHHLPKLEFKSKMGKMVPTAVTLEAREDFLVDILKTESERLKYTGGGDSDNPQRPASRDTTSATTSAGNSAPVNPKGATPMEPLGAINPAAKPAVDVEDDDDDLPF